ncbi:hypothetical protein Q8A73_014582 [Channa argus]|nr:hypothetical protein Q8A73_014582 [Channa argus]
MNNGINNRHRQNKLSRAIILDMRTRSKESVVSKNGAIEHVPLPGEKGDRMNSNLPPTVPAPAGCLIAGIPCSNPTCETHETGTTNTTTTAGAGGVRQCVQIHHVRPTRPEPPTLPLQVNLQINLKDISWNWFIRDRLTKDMITTVLGPPDVVQPPVKEEEPIHTDSQSDDVSSSVAFVLQVNEEVSEAVAQWQAGEAEDMSGALSLDELGVVHRLFPSWRSFEPVNAWLVPVVGQEDLFQPRRPCSSRPRHRGGNLENLRPLCRAPRTISTLAPPAPVRFGLINARSLAHFYP